MTLVDRCPFRNCLEMFILEASAFQQSLEQEAEAMKVLLLLVSVLVVVNQSRQFRNGAGRRESLVTYEVAEPYLESSIEYSAETYQEDGGNVCSGEYCQPKRRFAIAYLISQAAIASYFFLKALLCALFATCTSYPTVTTTTSVTVTNTITTITTSPTTTTTRTSTTTPTTKTTVKKTKSTTILPTTFTSVSIRKFRTSTTTYPTTTTTTTSTTPTTRTVTPVSTSQSTTITTSTETKTQSNNGNGRAFILNEELWKDILDPEESDIITDGMVIKPSGVAGAQLFTAKPDVRWDTDD